MVKDCVTVWDNCLQLIKSNVNEQSSKTWFEPIKPVRLEANALTIQVPNKFFYEWLEEHYVSILKKSIRQELGEMARLEYQFSMDSKGPGSGNGHNKGKVTPVVDTQVPGSFQTDEIKNPFVIPGIKKIRIDHQLNPNYTFENFIEGDCNRLARSAGEAVANKPGGTAFNPLVLFGKVGLGKTHLAQAIGNKIIQSGRDWTALYVTSEKFTNQIIQAIKNNAVSDFVNFYQLVDVLIVDDIQFLANRVKTQEIFFHIFNQLHQNGKQVILTSDRAPKDLPGMEERLISRFKWGLSADMQVPDFETRIAILEAKMQQEEVFAPRDVVEFICFNIQNNIRELEGVVASLVAYTSLTKRKVDKDLAKEVIQNFIAHTSKEVTLETIKKIVADYFDIAVDKLHSKTRKREIVMARQISMFLGKNMTKYSLKMIGEQFGGRDHSTVIYSCRAVQDLIDTDPDFKGTVEKIEKRINLSVGG
jgi:chromosomal replication initiator protein